MSSEGTMRHLFEVQVEPGMVGKIIATVREDKDVRHLEVIKSGSGHIYGVATSARCTVCREVARSNCFLASVSVESKGQARWTILGGGDSFRELTRKLEKQRIVFEVKLRKTLEDKDLLTARQEEILTIAFERGYFDFPKKTGLAKLAASTGVRASTLAEILRRGQRKILEEYLAKRSLLHED
jgi:predicted DNA binding protein